MAPKEMNTKGYKSDKDEKMEEEVVEKEQTRAKQDHPYGSAEDPEPLRDVL